MKKRLLICVLACQLLCQFALISFGQLPSSATPGQRRPNPPSPEAQRPTRTTDDDVVKITTNLVQVDAVITDRDGKPVTDLRPEEVQILEDGQPQKITNLNYIALDVPTASKRAEPAKQVDRNAPPVPPVRLRPEQVHRTMALVVDDLGLSFESVNYVRQALKKFIDQQMLPNDLVAIIRTGGGIGALQQFTSDKRLLYAAVDKVKWNPQGRGGITPFSNLGQDPSEPPSLGGDDRVDAPKGGTIDELRNDMFAVGTLGAINYIVRGLRELPGRKSIVLLSEGFRLFNKTDPANSTRVLTALNQLTELANRASVVIYTMDARGLQPLQLTAGDNVAQMSAQKIAEGLSDRRAEMFETQSGLNYLAIQTGGLAIRNTNDLNRGIKRVIEDQQGYYLIGYRPDDSTFDTVSGRRKFHKLSLKVNRPGKFTVRMRNGFFGVTDDDSKPVAKTQAQQLVGALASPFGAAGVHVRLTSLFATDPKLGSIMRSMIHVNGQDLTFTDEPDGWHKAVFDILAITFGDNGVIVDQLGRTHTLRLKGKSYERVLKDGLIYNLSVPVKKPGAYQLRTALRDVPSERVGSASQFIEVPDLKKNRLALSGLVVKGLPAQVFEKEGSGAAQTEETDDSVGQTDPNLSAAVRQFKQGLVVIYGAFIYNAQLDKAAGRPQLQTQVRVFRDGQQVFSGKEITYDASGQTDLKRLPLAGAIQLGSTMAPGEYVIQIIVTDALAKDKHRLASQWIDFEIVK
ncbi:MAG TPA: VWA domain-containing protein [Pyrinomonadaceae bacterium]|nr:VWA domain-containing protein [Pyrinomonadaceae bacterium]